MKIFPICLYSCLLLHAKAGTKRKWPGQPILAEFHKIGCTSNPLYSCRQWIPWRTTPLGSNPVLEKLKKALVSRLLLAFPQPNRPFELYVDASELGWGPLWSNAITKASNTPFPMHPVKSNHMKCRIPCI